MKTLLKIMLPLLLIVFVLAPGVTGFFVESAIDDTETGYQQFFDQQDVTLIDSSYERSWFSSDQTTELSLDNPQLASFFVALFGVDDSQALPTLLIETKANHGVLPIADVRHGGLRPAIAQTTSHLHLKYPSGKVVDLPLTFYSRVGTNHWGKLVADPVATQIKQQGQVAQLLWDGGSAEFTAGNAITYEGDVGKLSLNGAAGNLSLTPMKFFGSYEKTPFAFGQSSSTINLPRATMTMSNGQKLEVNNLRGFGDLKVVDSRAIVTTSFESGRMVLPSVKIDSTKIAMRYDLDAQAFSTFYSIMEQAGTPKSGHAADDPEMVLDALSTLLREGGRVAMENIDIGIEGAIVHADIDLSVPRGHNDPLTAFQNGTGSGNFLLPEAALIALGDYAPELSGAITMGAAIGIIEKRGTDYVAKIEFAQGVLLVNGLPVPLPF